MKKMQNAGQKMRNAEYGMRNGGSAA
jgi:hypothetical protein